MNHSWPEYQDIKVGMCEIRGSINAVWHQGKMIGCLTTRADLVGYRVDEQRNQWPRAAVEKAVGG